MKQNSQKIRWNQLGDQGFSLIELIISIVILVIIMLPIMNNFYRSAQMNKRAEEIQAESNLAASIMEGLKSLDIEETYAQFKGSLGAFHIITDPTGNPVADNIKILLRDAVVGVYEEAPSTDVFHKEQAIFYFAINGIKEGSTAYDALITVKTDSYTDTAQILNNYQMPDAINLDGMVNGILFSDGESTVDTLDSEALATFLQWGYDYARNVLFYQTPSYQAFLSASEQWEHDREIAEMEGDPIPAKPMEPTFNSADTAYASYCNEDTVRANINKAMKVIVNQASTNQISYDITYTCNWPSSSNLSNILTYPVSVKHYSKVIENVYLFYEPSIFKNNTTIHYDDINIINQTPTNKINFYIAEQIGSTLLPHITITQSDATSISLFTNLNSVYVNSAGSINGKLVKTEKKKRIYDITVQIYEYVDSINVSDKYKNELHSISSSNEN